MKKVLMLIAIVLGTTVMVNAQTEPAKTPAKEVKTVKHHKKHKKAHKAATATTTTTVKTDATK